jgi:hypothetical protein
MRLTKTDSKLGVALEVLKHVSIKRDDVGIGGYSDCREQGIIIANLYSQGNRVCSFSENKNSDDIVVQFGGRDDFDDYGVFKDSKMYDSNRKYFRCGEFEEAGEFITAWITDNIDGDK